jgi:sec-independent protein translocase protein TatC
VVQKAAFGWLIEQITEFATATVNAEDYLSIMMLLEVGFGIAFQLPLVIFYLSILHVVPYRTFRGQWRYVYVVLLVICGVVTPDASPITMVLMYAVMLSLYEISLAVARHAIMLRDGKEALYWTREQYAERELDKV